MKNRRGKDDKVFREIWEIVETETGKIGVVKAKGRKKKRERERETRGKRKDERRKEEEEIKRE